MGKNKLNSTTSGVLIDAERCVVTIENDFERIGLTPNECNQKVDYVFYRLLGVDWEENDSREITIKSLVSDDQITTTGKEFHQWFFKKEDTESKKIRSFWNSVNKAFKEKQEE